MCDDLRQAIRADIGDENPSKERIDDFVLNTLIGTGLKRLGRLIGLDVTITDGNLSRALTSTEFDLVLLQTECIIATRERYQAIRKGVKVKQDENSIDTSSNLSAFTQAVAGEGGVCSLLEKAIQDYLATGAISIDSTASKHGENIWHGNSKLYEDVDHDGQGNERIWSPQQNSFIDRDIDRGPEENRFNTW